jgi:hypothetical protein
MQTADRAGASITNTGARVHRAFLVAGLPPPTMRMRTIIGDAISAGDWLRTVADIAKVMLPAMEQHGIATPADLGIETVSKRLLQEVANGGGTIIGLAEIGAWSKL